MTGTLSSRQLSCDFCFTGDHNLCPQTIDNANPRESDGKWRCLCFRQNHILFSKSVTMEQ